MYFFGSGAIWPVPVTMMPSFPWPTILAILKLLVLKEATRLLTACWVLPCAPAPGTNPRIQDKNPLSLLVLESIVQQSGTGPTGRRARVAPRFTILKL